VDRAKSAVEIGIGLLVAIAAVLAGIGASHSPRESGYFWAAGVIIFIAVWVYLMYFVVHPLTGKLNAWREKALLEAQTRANQNREERQAGRRRARRAEPATQQSVQAASSSRGIVVSQALYGAGTQTRDVTKIVAGAVQPGGLRMPVTNDALGGDPAFSRQKRNRCAFVGRTRRWSSHLLHRPHSSIRLRFSGVPQPF